MKPSEVMTREEREAEVVANETDEIKEIKAHLRSIGAVDDNGRPDPAFYRPEEK